MTYFLRPDGDIDVLACELLAELKAARRENATLRELLYDALPSLGANGRSYAQHALVEACELLGSDPRDWSSHPDVLAAALAASPAAEEPQP